MAYPEFGSGLSSAIYSALQASKASFATEANTASKAPTASKVFQAL
jgi:hypothetical protein